ncbi:putative MFS family arabinose efflux permease [Rhizobium mesoamericanum]|nr:putative MFS family arabinose efflux permease [Rhizobium mesoamericanum]
MIFVGLQTWIIKAAGTEARPASSIYAALFNGAIGPTLGSFVMALGGIKALFLLATLITALGLVALLRVSSNKTAQQPTTQTG